MQDARSGQVLWNYDPKVESRKMRMAWGSRGLAYWNGKVYTGVQDGRLFALDARTGDEIWRTPRPNTGLPKSSWMTPLVWKHAQRTEIVTTGKGLVISYGLDGTELWRIGGMSMPTASPMSADGLLYVGTGSQGDANRPFMAVKPGASGDITLAAGVQYVQRGEDPERLGDARRLVAADRAGDVEEGVPGPERELRHGDRTARSHRAGIPRGLRAQDGLRRRVEHQLQPPRRAHRRHPGGLQLAD